jgi:hypothetical protein
MESIEETEAGDPRRMSRSLGRDELNLAEFPLTSLCRSVPPGCKSLVFEDRIRDQGTGEMVTRRLTISADDQYGLPTSLDEDVIVALIQVTKAANNFTDRTVPFSRYQLIELLGWPDNGQSLRRVDESLKRWLGVTLRYERAWWDKVDQSWVDEHFHILDNLSLYDQETLRRLKRKRAGKSLAPPSSSFSWNKVVFRSFQAENLKRLDLALYFQLSHPASKRAYRFLDKRFYRNRRAEFDLRDFACEHIGLSRNYTAAKIKEKLQPSLEELEAVGFLEPMSPAERYTNTGRGEWKIALVHKPSPVEERPPQPLPAPEPEGWERELIARGVTRITAAELVRDYPEGRIAVQVEALDWLSRGALKKVGDPAAYLVDAIRKDYAAPKGFETRAARQGREEAQRQRQEQEAEAKRRQRQEQVRERAEQAKVTKYWNALGALEQARLEAEALDCAEESLARSYQEMRANNNPVASSFLRLIRDAHIRRLLGLAETRA